MSWLACAAAAEHQYPAKAMQLLTSVFPNGWHQHLALATKVPKTTPRASVQAHYLALAAGPEEAVPGRHRLVPSRDAPSLAAVVAAAAESFGA